MEFILLIERKHPGPSLRPILEKWRDLIARYVEAQSDDAPYWYNEEATVSSLCSAIWLAGGVGLAEFRTTKDLGWSHRAKSDLWFRWKDSEYVLEAKQTWPNTVGSIGTTVRDRLKAAGRSFGRPKRDREFDVRLVFVVPKIAKRRYVFDASQWFDDVQRAVNAHFAVGWAFSGSGVDNERWRGREAHSFPGVFAVGQIRKFGAAWPPLTP